MENSVIERFPDEQEDTTAGNYFIANYPPFSFWNAEEVPQVDAVLDLSTPEDVSLGLYYHIPFCRKRCHFCYFRVYTDKNASEISAYIDATLAELKRYAERPYLQGRKPKFVYFGGGTPSYLSAKQLEAVTDGMKAVMPWDEAEEIAFEGEPGTLNPKKLEAIRRVGVTRLSLGVENFDDHVLSTNGRAHQSKEIFKAYDYAKKLDFSQLNIDLIAGMLEETDENWISCVDKTIDMEPDSVTIYQMEVPYNTTIYKNMKEQGKLVAPVANWKTKREWVNYAYNRLQAAGYTITSVTTAVKDPEKTKFVYRDQLWAGADLLSMGVASFGHLGGFHYQNAAHFDEYMEKVRAGELPITRALFVDKEERMIREFILQMKTGSVDLSYFKKKFGGDLEDFYRDQFAALIEKGLARIENGIVTLSRYALLKVDTFLQDFFLPKHRGARYT